MSKKIQKSVLCLTLYKQDIRAIAQLFQENLQDAEITIDNGQIEDFDENYRAKSLVAQGYEILGESASGESVRQLVALKISQRSAVLLASSQSDKKMYGVAKNIEEVLLRCQNRAHQYLVGSAYLSACFVPISLEVPLQQHHLPFVIQLLFIAGSALFLVPVFLFLLFTIVRSLKLDRYIFLLPGTVNPTQKYGNREAVGTAIIALVLAFIFSVSLSLAVALLWR